MKLEIKQGFRKQARIAKISVPKWNFDEQRKWQLSNNFVKPNEQSQIYLNFVVARN